MNAGLVREDEPNKNTEMLGRMLQECIVSDSLRMLIDLID
jgi:hypothetical protein